MIIAVRESLRPIVFFYLRLFHRIEYHGLENIPPAGPAVIVSNHPSYLDPLSVSVGIKRPVRMMAWDAIFRVPVLGWLVRALGAFPINPHRPDKRALQTAESFIREGHMVGIFPEGGRSYQPLMGRLWPGAVRLALRTRAPIIPVCVAGAFRVWPRFCFLPRPGKIRVTILPPILVDPSRSRKEQTEDVLQEIQSVINKELVKTVVSWHAARLYDVSAPEIFLGTAKRQHRS